MTVWLVMKLLRGNMLRAAPALREAASWRVVVQRNNENGWWKRDLVTLQHVYIVITIKIIIYNLAVRIALPRQSPASLR